MRKKFFNYRLIINLFFILMCVTFIVPMLYVISISFSSNASIDASGYSLIPTEWSLDAYRYVFRNPEQVLNSYKTTIFASVVGSFLSVFVMALMAYPLSRPNFVFKKPITFFVFFTMLFGGGLIPSYILNTQYLGLANSIWIYILPGLASAWHIIIIRTFFQQLPPALVEAAKIDGAREMRVFFTIILPLSKPVLASVLFMMLTAKWNDWQTSLIYIRDETLYTLQYTLQKVLNEVEFLKNLAKSGEFNVTINADVPTEPMRFALVIVAAGPMLVVFPFFQKYFSKGLTVGAVKG
ncbi:MAG: carbohydrate ABC transporter permease [Clostridia bacterium]|nr:carbohydrate ABC transporter permease [Clostridia bacterium]